MFSFFKRKEDPIIKILNQYSENVQRIAELYLVKNSLTESAVESLRADNLMLGELYFSIEQSTKVEITKKDLTKPESVMRGLLTPKAHTYRAISLHTDCTFNELNEVLGQVVLINRATNNYDMDYEDLYRLIDRKDEIKKSKLKKKIKEIYMKKHIISAIEDFIVTRYTPMVGGEMAVELFKEIDIDSLTYEYVEGLQHLDRIYDVRQPDNEFQTMVAVPWKITAELDKNTKYIKALMAKNDISIVYSEDAE